MSAHGTGVATPLLLSYRRASALLGVGRNNTLPVLIERGLLRPVEILGKRYIPLEQVQELARNGEAPRGERANAPVRSAMRKGKGSIADLKL